MVPVGPSEAEFTRVGAGPGRMGAWREGKVGRDECLVWAWLGGQLAHRGHQVLQRSAEPHHSAEAKL